MNENEKINNQTQLSPETEKLISAKSRDELEELDRIDQMKKEHAKEMKNMRESVGKALDKLKEYSGDNEKTKNELSAKEREIEALKEALMKQKKLSSLTETERYMSEGERVGTRVLEIIDKRLEERYGSRK